MAKKTKKRKASKTPKMPTIKKKGAKALKESVSSNSGKRKKTTGFARAKKKPKAAPRTPGRKPYLRDEATAAQVETLKGLGMTQDEICLIVINPQTEKPISDDTLRMYYGPELKAGKPKGIAAVANSLFKRAIGDSPQAAACSMFYLKCQGGWKEQPTVVDMNVTSGVLVSPPGMSPAEWVATQAAKASGSKEPGKAEEE